MSPDYGTAFGHLRTAAGADWPAYTGHEFVTRLGNGTLPRAAFVHYLAQDYVFLNHFSRAWALAVAKSETHAEMEAAVATLNALITHEMPLHVRICEAEGIAPDHLFATRERPENLAYTRFVLEAGYSGDLLDLLAALAPCVMGYGEIGARLAAQPGVAPAYGDWIDTYAGDAYQAACRDTGALLDRALERRLGAGYRDTPRWARLCNTFATATRLEIGFWQMGLTP